MSRELDAVTINNFFTMLYSYIHEPTPRIFVDGTQLYWSDIIEMLDDLSNKLKGLEDTL